jgi:hypothetical protein
MKSELEQLRNLRKRTGPLLIDLVPDLSAFLNEKNLTFRRRPEQPSDEPDVKVTTTCSCLMAAALSRRLDDTYKSKTKKPKTVKDTVEAVFRRVVKAKWESSGLSEDNPFSTVLVLRACGLLISSGTLDMSAVEEKKDFAGTLRSLADIAKWLLDGDEFDKFKISAYPPKAAVLYWFVDAVDRLKVAPDEKHWRSLCRWAGAEFRKQRSLIVAQHESLMDPIAMAMSACLSARLQEISRRQKFDVMTDCLRHLPTNIELEHAVSLTFAEQGKSGIWPKYFPLFHYPTAGSNFCFTFEMLEAILAEFGKPTYTILENQNVISGLERAVDWCFHNRLLYSVDGAPYRGWNSGGELDSLNDGKPESWATAVVYMFLWELDQVLASRIQNRILSVYNASPGEKFADGWDKLVDVPLKLRTNEDTTLKEFLRFNVIESANKFTSDAGAKIDGRVSALMFGPPGTSKTRLTRAVAGVLKWPIIEIDPSTFLSDGIENIYSRADQIFADLQDLSGVVVLFDEMDALVQTRGSSERLDITSQFLTTSMLPKLARLHDYGRLVFFFATNYQSKFDQAIKRPGRFDLLVFVGPPTWQGVLGSLEALLSKTDKGDAAAIKVKIEAFTSKVTKRRQLQLDLLTFSEKQSFLEMLRGKSPTLLAALDGMDKDAFFQSLEDFSKFITLRPDVADYKQWWDVERFESGLQ